MNKYTRMNWENTPSKATPLTADNLNHMDEGIERATDGAIALETEITTARGGQNSLGARLDTADANLAKKADKATTLAGYGITDGENIGNKVTDKRKITDEDANYPSIGYLHDYYYDCNEVDDALSGKLGNTAGSVTTDNIASKAVTTEKLSEDVTNQFSKLKEELAELYYDNSIRPTFVYGQLRTDTGIVSQNSSSTKRAVTLNKYSVKGCKITADAQFNFIIAKYDENDKYLGYVNWRFKEFNLDDACYIRLLVCNREDMNAPVDLSAIDLAIKQGNAAKNEEVAKNKTLKTISDLYKMMHISGNILTIDKGLLIFDDNNIYADEMKVELVPGNTVIIENIGGKATLSCVPDKDVKNHKVIGNIGKVSSTGNFLVYDYNYKIGAAMQRISDLEEKTFIIGQSDNVAEVITEAMKTKGSIVYIEPYEHDCYAEWKAFFGDDYFETLSTGRGIELKNDIHIIGKSGCLLTCHYTGNSDYIQENFSLFNNSLKGSGYTIENVDFDVSKIRYIIHDERANDKTPYKVRYSRCGMKQDNSESTWDKSRACIGGGLGQHGDVVVEDCVFDTVTSDANIDSLAYHGSSGDEAQNTLVIKNCYCKGNSTLQIASYGASTKKSKVIIANCSFGSPIEELHWDTQNAPNYNMDILYINNEIRSEKNTVN